MVIESLADGKLKLVGERFLSQGRLMPADVQYVTSWMSEDGSRCFQVMEAPTREALQGWIANWEDLVEFEVVEILTSQEYWARN